MKLKVILGSVIILGLLVFLSFSFMENKVEYGTITDAMKTQRKIQVKGAVVVDKGTKYDSDKNEFVFFMKDDDGATCQVVFSGAKPNNFEVAEAVVVKGRYIDGFFHASDILTKCPSKYEGTSEQMKKTL
ncbi:MAG: cytochrome c maturation protein CcmE [Ignavibacteriales bacterium]|nr:cytochrome c maturation protein CcmE [Ignavibacteriales bacterium]